MKEEALITDAMRKLLDKEWPPVVLDVDRTSIRMWARAVGFDDPVFYDEDSARERGYDRLPAPPGFLGHPRYRPGQTDPGPPIRGLNPKLTRSLNGGTEFEYMQPVLAGDELTAITKIVDLKEREGSIGKMVIITRETTYRRDSEVVARMRATVINY
jgi:hydroxyacyl-ACP dehydratase HTD2-like protein with hotdog domain